LGYDIIAIDFFYCLVYFFVVRNQSFDVLRITCNVFSVQPFSCEFSVNGILTIPSRNFSLFICQILSSLIEQFFIFSLLFKTLLLRLFLGFLLSLIGFLFLSSQSIRINLVLFGLRKPSVALPF